MGTRSLFALASVAAMLLLGCPSAQNAAAGIRPTPAMEGAKCSVAKSQSKPLIVEWPSADRATLEGLSRQRVVAVRYVGCEMEVLSTCEVPAKYAYTPITPKSESVRMRDADDLYANVPLGAAKLEAKLSKYGELNVSMTIVGRWQAERVTFRRDELRGDCANATHVVSGMATGAFDFFAGAGAEVGGGASIAGAGGGASSTSARETLNRDGDAAQCSKSTNDDKAPPFGCGALLRIEVAPIKAGEDETCAASCSKLLGCGLYNDGTCMAKCSRPGRQSEMFRECAKGAADDCSALVQCVWRAGASEDCPGGGGFPAGSATCEQTTNCEHACGTSMPCVCGCNSKASPAAALPVLNNALCYNKYCAGKCENASATSCTTCWARNCKSQWDDQCKGH